MFQKGRGQTILIEHLFLSQESKRSFGCKENRQTRSQQERIMDFHYFFLAPIIFIIDQFFELFRLACVTELYHPFC